MLLARDERRFWHSKTLDLNLMQAHYVDYAYPRHTHDHFVIGIIEQGVQSFFHHGTTYTTPPSGLILINPGIVHTGEAATEKGFVIRSLYPSVAHMKTAVQELTGRSGVPYFREVRVDDLAATASVRALHRALTKPTSLLEQESRLITTLAGLIRRYGDVQQVGKRPLGQEHQAIRQAREFIEAHYSQPISLKRLAQQVALSPYYLLRVFHQQVGLPPHAYLQDVRVRRAQQLIEQGVSLAETAVAVGFNSQSHLTRRFKPVVGLTPGQYARQVN